MSALRAKSLSFVDALQAIIGTSSDSLFGEVAQSFPASAVSNASRTCLMDLHTLQWCEECASKFGIELCALPKICSNSEEYGRVAAGPMTGVPICGCLGDQQAALLGQRCTQGEAKNTYGTGCFLLVHTGHKPVLSGAGLLTTVAYQLGRNEPATYAIEGSIAIAGMAVAWLRDQMGLISHAADSETLASAVDDTGTLQRCSHTCEPCDSMLKQKEQCFLTLMLSAAACCGNRGREQYQDVKLCQHGPKVYAYQFVDGCRWRVLCSSFQRATCATLARRCSRRSSWTDAIHQQEPHRQSRP
jgi:FGGY family of carbohydrate kinases, C-terminal domain/FGGY family of carbohydrate kinases, N-terminal domain